MTPTVCVRGSGGRPGETTGRRRRHPRKQHVIWARGAGAPGEDRCPGGGATPHSPKGALAHRLFPQVGGYRRWGPARRGRGPEAPQGPRPRLPPSQPGGGGGSAQRPREAILAAGPPKAREALRLTVSRSRPHRGRCPPRARRGRGARPAAGRRSERGGHGGAAGVWASCRRDPGGGASRGRGERGRGAVTYTGPQPPPPPPRCG